MSQEPEGRGRPWPAPSVNGSPSTDGQWWRGGAEPFPLWPATSSEAAPASDAPPVRESPPITVVAEPIAATAPVSPMGPPVAAFLARPGRTARSVRPVAARPARLRELRHPAFGLSALVVFALLAGFFSWVSAEPFWLSVGHDRAATATVSSCTGTGIRHRCLATVSGPGFRAERVTLVGVQGVQGKSYEARVVGSDARIAYVGSGGALHLRWLFGLLLVLLCGLGIAWGTGTSRLPTRRTRLAALGTSVAAPLVLFVATVLAAW